MPHATKKPSPTAVFIEPPHHHPFFQLIIRTTPLPRFRFRFHSLPPVPPLSAIPTIQVRLWLEVHIHWLFVSKYDASMWYRHHSSSNIPGQNEKHLRHDFCSFTNDLRKTSGFTMELWVYHGVLCWVSGKVQTERSHQKKEKNPTFLKVKHSNVPLSQKLPNLCNDISAGSSSP